MSKKIVRKKKPVETLPATKPKVGKCSCGHPQDEHHDTGPHSLGQGACKTFGCGCVQFTWVGFLDE